jgi:hypothetical protein
MKEGLPYEFAVSHSLGVLWEKFFSVKKQRHISRILIVDDGANVLLSIPWSRLEGMQILGTEQTQLGLNRLESSVNEIPLTVNVAGCPVKKLIESQFIGKATADKMCSLGLLDSKPKVGIAGEGSIGSAIGKELAKLGISYFTYDVLSHFQIGNGIRSLSSLDSVMNRSDIIVGCTGTDFLRGVALERVQGNKILVSASSADVEFQSLLAMASFGKGQFETVDYGVHSDLEIHILNGGYPINFDREKEWEPSEDIQITRCLLYAGLVQALQTESHSGQRGSIIPLNAGIQEKIVDKWQDLKQRTNTFAAHAAEITETYLRRSAQTNPVNC